MGNNLNNTNAAVDALLEAARKETDIQDFGEDGFIEPLQKLLESVDQDVSFNEMGRMAFNADMQRFLTNRLRFAEDLRQHPEILEEHISDPIIVLGLARTGTSKLQRMMSADPHVQKLYLWKLLNPARILNAETSQEEALRIDMARQASAMVQQLFPRFTAAHPMIAEEVDEELLLTQFSFENPVLYMMTPAHGYYDWVRNRDFLPCYQYMAQLIQYLQWQDGGRKNRRWILKSPMHIGNLNALSQVFPKATLVHCHRDINEVIPSFCNLQEAGWLMRSDSIDPTRVGEVVLDLWATEMDKYLHTRKQMESNLNIIDIPYQRIHKEPMIVIAEIYKKAGLDLSADSVTAMQQWQEDNPKNRHGSNDYSLEKYGLSTGQVESRFADYLNQFVQYTQ